MPIRLLLIDDHALFREGLRAVLDLRAEFDVVAEGGTAGEALPAYEKHRPDITLLDLRLPDASGIDALRQIRAADAKARVLMLTTYDGDEDIHRALEAGASGYLLKNIPSKQLFEAIRAVHQGRTYVPPAVQQRLEERDAFQELTARELETVALIARGLSNKEIARILAVSEVTVKTHVRNILAKFGVEARTEAAMLAVQRGLVSI